MRYLNFPALTHINSAIFFEKATFDVTEIMKSIEIELRDEMANTSMTTIQLIFEDSDIVQSLQQKQGEKNGKNNNLIRTLLMKNDWFETTNYTKFGRCFAFQIPPWIKDLKVSPFEFYVYRGFVSIFE